MARRKNEVANVIENNTANVVENVVTKEVTNEVTNEKEVVNDSVLPLADSADLVTQIESGENESVKKRECMEIIRLNFRAPVPSALILMGRFFREGCPCDSDTVAKIVEKSGLSLNSEDSAVAAWALGLDAPEMAAFTRAANAWWRLAGDYESATIEEVIEFANKNTSLPNDVYFCEIKKEWLFVDGRLVIFSGSNNDGKKLFFAPGCYYQIAENNTANYIRAVGSVGYFLAAKRREVNEKQSMSFALGPNVSQYIKKVLLAGFLDALDIANIANDMAAEIEKEKKDKKAQLTKNIENYDFAVIELSRKIDDLQKVLNGKIGSAKRKKTETAIKNTKQKLSAAKSGLSCAKMEFEKLG